MSDLLTPDQIREFRPITPNECRLHATLLDWLRAAWNPELPEQPDEPSRAQIEADWTAFNGATFYRFDADAEAIKEGLKEVRRRSG